MKGDGEESRGADWGAGQSLLALDLCLSHLQEFNTWHKSGRASQCPDVSRFLSPLRAVAWWLLLLFQFGAPPQQRM